MWVGWATGETVGLHKGPFFHPPSRQEGAAKSGKSLNTRRGRCVGCLYVYSSRRLHLVSCMQLGVARGMHGGRPRDRLSNETERSACSAKVDHGRVGVWSRSSELEGRGSERKHFITPTDDGNQSQLRPSGASSPRAADSEIAGFEMNPSHTTRAASRASHEG